MSYGIRIVGLTEVQRALGINIRPAIKAATLAIAEQIQDEISPYPPSTTANSPSQKRWYERGYGPKWRLVSGEVHGVKTSQTMGRRWGVKASGGMGHVVGNAATYSGYLHRADKQVRWANVRQWVTDRTAINRVVKSGAAKEIVIQAIMRLLRGRS